MGWAGSFVVSMRVFWRVGKIFKRTWRWSFIEIAEVTPGSVKYFCI